MQAQVRQAMEQGALGVASSLSGPAGSWIDTDTLVAMCKVASANTAAATRPTCAPRVKASFEAVAEAMDIGRRAGVPVDIIHLKIADHELWGQMPELVASIAQARANGQDVTANVYPYRAGQNDLATIIPPWAHEGGAEAMLKRLRDPALHDRLVNEIEHGIPGSNWYDHYTATGSWEGMLLVSLSNPDYKKFEGRRMNEVIEALGGKPFDVLFQLLEANSGSVPTIYFHHDENDMRYALKQPFVSIGSDGTAIATTGPTAEGHPHPRYYGTFPRVLGRYVRDEKVLTLEDAVRKMTSANAVKIHVYDRGLLRPGMWADVTVFRPRHYHRQRHLGKAASIRHGSPLRTGKRKAGHRRARTHRRAPRNHPLRAWQAVTQRALGPLLCDRLQPVRGAGHRFPWPARRRSRPRAANSRTTDHRFLLVRRAVRSSRALHSDF